jgi:hypothetical protein
MCVSAIIRRPKPVLADKVRNDGGVPGGEGVFTLGSDPLGRPQVAEHRVDFGAAHLAGIDGRARQNHRERAHA